MPTSPEPECVRIKREAQASINRLASGMSRVERDALVNRLAAEFARSLGVDRVSSPIGRGREVTGEETGRTTSAA